MLALVDEPHALGADENQSVEDRAGRLQDADHRIDRIAVHGAAFGQPVRADESIADAESRMRRDRRPQRGFHPVVPETSRPDRASVEPHVVLSRADDPKAAKAVAQRERDHVADQRIRGELLRCPDRDVAGRRVQVKDPGEDQLHRAALRPDHEIDAPRVAVEAVADLSIHDQHESDGCDAERQQQDVEQRAERPRAQIAPRELHEIHAGMPPFDAAARAGVRCVPSGGCRAWR